MHAGIKFPWVISSSAHILKALDVKMKVLIMLVSIAEVSYFVAVSKSYVLLEFVKQIFKKSKKVTYLKVLQKG